MEGLIMWLCGVDAAQAAARVPLVWFVVLAMLSPLVARILCHYLPEPETDDPEEAEVWEI